jgi:predicted exporter
MARHGNSGFGILKMGEHSRAAKRRLLPWLILGVMAAAVLVMRLQVSFDLSAFFPQKSSLQHEVLLEQYRNGPGSRLLVIGLSGVPRVRLA